MDYRNCKCSFSCKYTIGLSDGWNWLRCHNRNGGMYVCVCVCVEIEGCMFVCMYVLKWRNVCLCVCMC